MMFSDRLAFLTSSIMFLFAFIFHSGANSDVTWIASAFQPFELLVYVFVFIGGLIFVYAYTNSIRWGLALAALGTFGYWVWTTGAVLGWF